MDKPKRTTNVVGESVAARLSGPSWSQRFHGPAPQVQSVFADLASTLEAGEESGPCDILVVRLNAIQRSTAEQLSKAVARLRVNHTTVLYNFGAETILDAMRTAGMILRREPISDAELAEVIHSVSVVDTAAAKPAFGAGGTVPPRRYSDAVLARFAAQPTPILCEFPRHIVDLINQLASFEDYSRQCLDASAEDARVHAYLRSISGSARELFENALELVMDHAPMPPATGG